MSRRGDYQSPAKSERILNGRLIVAPTLPAEELKQNKKLHSHFRVCSFFILNFYRGTPTVESTPLSSGGLSRHWLCVKLKTGANALPYSEDGKFICDFNTAGASPCPTLCNFKLRAYRGKNYIKTKARPPNFKIKSVLPRLKIWPFLIINKKFIFFYWQQRKMRVYYITELALNHKEC